MCLLLTCAAYVDVWSRKYNLRDGPRFLRFLIRAVSKFEAWLVSLEELASWFQILEERLPLGFNFCGTMELHSRTRVRLRFNRKVTVL